MTTLTFDMESYYDKEYSLSKMTTQQYVYDPRFQVIGLSVQVDDGKPESFTGSLSETLEFVQQFPWDTSLAVAHNALFDGLILEGIFHVHPKAYHCTMMAANALSKPFNGSAALAKTALYYDVGVKGTEVMRAIGMRREDFTPAQIAAYMRYCRQDTNLCYKIFRKQLPHLPVKQRMMLNLTTLKGTRPVIKLNKKILTNRLADVKQSKEDLLVRCGLDSRKGLMSNDKFADLLSVRGVIPPLKISPTTGKEAYAFAKKDKGMLELLEHPDVTVQALVAARIGVKSTQEETRLERFIGVADTQIPMSIPLLYFGAHTGRLSGTDKLNMQNLQRGGELRRALVAAYGMKLVAGDLSQIEARIVAMLAGCTPLIEAFAAGEDVYSMFASELYGMEVNGKDNPEERRVGKTAILGLGFQMGAERFRESCRVVDIDVTLNEAKRVVSTYRRAYPQVPALWKACGELIKCMGAGQASSLGPVTVSSEGVRLPNGMMMYYPELSKSSEGWSYKGRYKRTKIYSGKLTENIVQALANIVLNEAEIRLALRGLRATLTVHDELVYTVPEQHVPAVTKALQISLTAPVPWMPGLPLACEVNSGDSYASCK